MSVSRLSRLLYANNRRSWTPCSPKKDEEGSLVVALLVLLVALGLALAVTTTSFGDIRSVGNQQNYSAALTKANAGIADALWQLDQTNPNDYPDQFCGGAPGCNVPTIPGQSNVQYGMTLHDGTFGTYYVIDSKGTAFGKTAVVRSHLYTSGSSYQFAMYGKSNLTLNGVGAGQLTGLVGSNQTVTCSGGGVDGSGQVAFGTGTVTGCSQPLTGRGRFAPQDPLATCPAGSTSSALAPCIPSTVIPLACPNSGIFSGNIVSGTYLCTGSVSFSKTVNITSVVSDGDYDVSTAPSGVPQTSMDYDSDDGAQIFVIPPSGSTANISMSRSYDNFNGPDSGVPCANSGTYSAPASQLQVYLAGSGTIDVGTGNANAGCFSGLLYAPSASLTVNGGFVLNGSMIINNSTVNGNPNLILHHSKTLQNMAPPPWSILDYRQVPTSTFTFKP